VVNWLYGEGVISERPVRRVVPVSQASCASCFAKIKPLELSEPSLYYPLAKNIMCNHAFSRHFPLPYSTFGYSNKRIEMLLFVFAIMNRIHSVAADYSTRLFANNRINGLKIENTDPESRAYRNNNRTMRNRAHSAYDFNPNPLDPPRNFCFRVTTFRLGRKLMRNLDNKLSNYINCWILLVAQIMRGSYL